jgi:malate dehydrogenase (oxaloacetate-decarboxylating)
MSDFDARSLDLHEKHRGKLEVRSKFPLRDRADMSVAYTPGVAAVCSAVHADPDKAFTHTIKGNSVAVVSDGSAVLGLGDIGPLAAMPVMEGKCVLFKEFADIDAYPIVLDTKDPLEIIKTVERIAPGFGGINLEDIAAPKCFEIEDSLQTIGIPVFHDDQHGTAIVLMAALLNACKVTGKKPEDLRVVINGAGAAGTAIAKLLRCVGQDPNVCIPVRDILVCDTKGIISRTRSDLNHAKKHLLIYTNRDDHSGSLFDAIRKADVFIGVSVGGLLNEEHIRTMAPEPFVFAMANPVPEIMPDVALAAGASVVGTGRSDLPNQVNNVLAFPGIFRGAIDARATRITDHMKIAAAHALAECVQGLTPGKVLPAALDRSVAPTVAEAVQQAWDEMPG